MADDGGLGMAPWGDDTHWLRGLHGPDREYHSEEWQFHRREILQGDKNKNSSN